MGNSDGIDLNGTTPVPARPRAGGLWSAVVLAGSRPEGDPLAAAFGLPAKALVPVAGEPMLGRVARTLLDCPSVARVVVIAQEPERLAQDALRWMASDPRVVHAAGGASITASLSGVLGTPAAPWPVLITTADHPLLTPEIIEYFLSESRGSDVTLGIVERDLLLARYPENRRTWLRFRGGAYTGANLFTAQSERALAAVAAFAAAESDRKKRLSLLWHFGPVLALGAAMRALSIEQGIARVGRGLGVDATAVPLPFAEAGMDVDRRGDHELVERILAARNAVAAPLGAEAEISIFDLDRTLTRRGTFTPFLLYAAWRLAPWRLLLAPAALYSFLLHLAGRMSRKRLKERLQHVFLGDRVPRRRIDEVAAAFARRLRAGGFRQQGLRQISEEKRQGRRVLLATAANAFCVAAIAEELGVDEIVCTQSGWDGDDLRARIEGPNCYGSDKLAMIEAYLNRSGRPRSAMHVRFFSDHHSDACVLAWADEAFVVNPKPPFRAYAGDEGWAVLSWA
ncbi:MAG TPA: HAD-IB family phosphatase [Allosphingosinicella sp.]|nr:HAD-IB family phosphatase [Allosphingosinicella sp.]